MDVSAYQIWLTSSGNPAGYENQIRQLKDKRDVATLKLQELKSSGSEAWDTLKAGAETAWTDLKSAVTAAKEKFKKPGEPLN